MAQCELHLGLDSKFTYNVCVVTPSLPERATGLDWADEVEKVREV